jgi:MFS family permease
MPNRKLDVYISAPAAAESTKTAAGQRLPIFRLILLTAAAVAIHGYHLGVEDAEIHLPAAKKLLNPQLYPFADEFFMTHEHMSLFSPILAWSARLTHLPMDWIFLLWYVVGIFALLASCWMLAAISFRSPRARWCSLLVITAVLTMPATNTGLLLIDPYLTPRSFSTPLSIFALATLLERRYILAVLAIAATTLIHLQMGAFLLLLMAFVLLAEWMKPVVRHRVPEAASIVGIFPKGFPLTPAQGPYREALYARDYFFLSNWTWYDWIGMLAPLAILAWFWRGKVRGTTPEFRRLSFALIPFGLLSILVAAVFTSSHTLDMFARLQPLRCFQLITLVFMVYLGGVVGEYAAKGRSWVLPAIFLPLAGGMFLLAGDTYSHSPHIELPWLKTSSNDWVNTLLWVRENTPTDAVFAVDSRYFLDHGVDVHGFRVISERSDLADYFKDGGAVAMFPDLADKWKQMSNATYGLNHFRAEDFKRLAGEYPVTWAVIHGPAPVGLDCPYQQRGYAVCRILR